MAKTNQISQRSTGTAASNTPQTGGVVIRTPARNSAAYNPGGTGGAAGRKSPSAVPTPGGRKIVGQKGRTVAGTNKTIGTNGGA